MKTCPKCKKPWLDNFETCPECHVGLSSNLDNHSDNIDNDRVNRVQTNDATQDLKHSNVNIGDGNAVSGGVHSSDNHTKTGSDNTVQSNNKTQINSGNTTNNTTIYEVEKSASEKLKENCLRYRQECKDLFKDGLISKDGERKLRELQVNLGLADELVSDIKEEVRQQSKTREKQLPLAGRHDINQTKSIIEQNTEPALQRQLDKLGSWMQEYDDSTLNLMYYQMSSMLEPVRYTNRYEDSVKDEYWEAYWAYIAYLLQNKEKQANEALASLGRWHSFYPEQNDTILLLAGRLMLNEPIEDVQQVRNQLTTRFTSDLQLLLDTIDELLQMDWMRETVYIRPAHTFYVNTLFKQFVDTQKLRGEKFLKQKLQQKEQERIIETKRIHEQTLVQQAAERARAEAEAERLRLEAAKAEAVVIQARIDAAEAETEAERIRLETAAAAAAAEKDRLARAEAETAAEEMRLKSVREKVAAETKQQIEAEIKQKKTEFKTRFDQNRCDILKTCAETGISSSQYHEWRRLDPIFNDELAYVIRTHKNIDKEQKGLRRKEFFKKNKPYFRVALILALIILGISLYMTNQIAQQYKDLRNDFVSNFKKIEDSYDGYDYISKNCDVINEMRTKENSFYFTGEKKSDQFVDSLKTKIEDLLEIHQRSLTTEEDSIKEDARKRTKRLADELCKL